MFKKIFIVIILISLIFSFNSYTNSGRNLDDQSYVMAIGIDVGENADYKISLQLSTLESSATESSIKSDSNKQESSSSSEDKSSEETSNYMIYTVDTNSLDNAINIADAYLNKNIDLSHCKILLLSEEIAKKGISTIVNSITNKVKIRPDCNIIISQIPINEFTDTQNIKFEKLLSKYYDVTSNVETGRGYSELIHLNDFYLKLNDNTIQPITTLGIVNNSSASTNKNQSFNNSLDFQSKSFISSKEDYAVETIGLAVFNEDKLIGTLTANETLCYEILTNNLNYCNVNFPSPLGDSGTIDLEISSLKSPKIKVTMINGSPFVEINTFITSKILSFNNNSDNTINEEKINIIRNSFIKYMETEFYNYLNKTSKELNSDISGIGRYSTKNFRTISDFENYKWLQNYKNCVFKVNVVASMKSGHILSNK